jgi:hypothetical protein
MGFLNGNSKEYHDTEVYLAELARENDDVLEGFYFEGCRLKGPAVLLVEGEFNLSGNEIEGDPDAFLWPIASERERVIGAILIKDSKFKGCTFSKVGLAGYPNFIEQVRQSVETQPAVS